MPMYVIWLAVTILAAVVEAAIPGLVAVWFVPGGIAALIASLAGGPLWLQVLLFVGISAAALALTRPLARRLRDKRREPTNADRVLGEQAVVTQEIDDLLGTGRVEVHGVSWSARTPSGEGKIPSGSVVTVQAIEGVKLLVAPAAKD